MKFSYFILLYSLIFPNLSCQESESPVSFIPANSDKIYYEGRIGRRDSLIEMYWSGTQIQINFKGTGVKAILQDNKGDNYYNIILNNDSLWILRPDTAKREYILASQLVDKEHNIVIYKRTEWNRGTTYFYGFRLDNGTEILNPPKRKRRKMEFYGNSITAGYGVEDFSGSDRADSIYTNNYLSYAAFTSRHFDAECNYIVRSGIGIMASFVYQTMPEIYQLTNPNLSRYFWNFSRYQPDIVVINLLQNDSWLINMPQSKEYKARFENSERPDENYIIGAYASFVEAIRNKYPNANIICMLGNMSITKKGSPWMGYVQKAVDSMNDPNIYTLFIPYNNSLGHPRVNEQKKIAESLIRFIDRNIRW